MNRASTHSHMQRLDRISSLLKSDHLYTVAELAKELNISPRTLHRDINLLRDKGYPIESDRGRGGGIRLHYRWGIGKLRLTPEETIDLLISLSISDKMQSPLFLGHLKSIRHKLLALLSNEQKRRIQSLRKRIRIGTSASPDILHSFEQSPPIDANTLGQAFLFQQCLSMEYSDGVGHKTQRVIEPHYLYLNYPVWYLLAYNHLRQEVRTFRCDRVLWANIIEEHFTLRAFDEFQLMLNTDRPTEL